MTIETDWEELSLWLEGQTGYDSIPTIVRVYDQSESGAYKCPVPGCRTKRKDAAALWEHTHFKGHVPPSFGTSSVSMLVLQLEEAGWPEPWTPT